MLPKGTHHVISNPEISLDNEDEKTYKYRLPKSIQEQFGINGPLIIQQYLHNPQNFLVCLPTETRELLQFAHPQMTTELGFDYIDNGIYSLPTGHAPEESLMHGFCKGPVAIMVEHNLKNAENHVYITSPKIALDTMLEMKKNPIIEVSNLYVFSEWVVGLNIEHPQVTNHVASDVDLS